jgi:hypothetical protein
VLLLFSVSKFIWHDLITSMDNGVDNFPYAPHVMYIIELVTGYVGDSPEGPLKNWGNPA